MKFKGLEPARKIDIKKRKVKHARICVDKNLVVTVTTPLNFTLNEVNDLLNRKSKWILKQLDYFKSKNKESIRLEINEIMFLGHIYKFMVLPELKKSYKIDNTDKTIISGQELFRTEILLKWYKEQAKRIITERLNHFTSQYNFTYTKFSVRSQKTRWGSCSMNKNLSFNWKLIQTPPTILDYIVVHELVHTRIFNHSKKYWEQVALIYPDYKNANKWLKNYNSAGF